MHVQICVWIIDIVYLPNQFKELDGGAGWVLVSEMWWAYMWRSRSWRTNERALNGIKRVVNVSIVNVMGV